MQSDLIPELHDIGKIVDSAAVVQDVLKHPELGLRILDVDTTKHSLNWVDWGSDPLKSLASNINLEAVRWHHPTREHGDKYEKLPQDIPPPSNIRFRKQMLLLKIADHYASTFSRSVAESSEHDAKFKALGDLLGYERKRNVLWYQNAVSNGAAITQVIDFLPLLKMLETNGSSADAFFRSYQIKLEHLPEDPSAPRDVTSLLTHMELVGRLYRFLAESYADTLNDDTQPWLDQKYKVRTVKQAEGREWLMTLATCRVQIPQHPVRVGDLNVFRTQEQVLEQIKQDYKNQVLFCTSDTVWLMLPSSKQVDVGKVLDKVLSPLFRHGLWVETRSLRDVNLRPKQPEIQRLRWHNDEQTRQEADVRETSVHGELEKEFDPPICSICQMRPATKQWPRDSRYSEVQARGGTLEDLCEICLDIRDIPADERFKQLAQWHPDTGDRSEIKTAWVKLTLDYDRLIDYLGGAFSGYIESLRGRVPKENLLALEALKIAEEEFNPLALMADFTEDYRRMTQAIDARLRKDEWEYESIRKEDFRDFFVVKVKNGADVLRFLQLYGEALLNYFPDALKDCPVRIAVNVSLTKYPFYEHWRWISEPTNAVNLQMPGIARVQIDAPEFLEFLTRLNLTDPRGELRLTRTYLEKLRTTEVRSGRSQALLSAVMLADVEAKRIPYQLDPFIQMIKQNKIKIQDILDWYKITTWGRER